MVPGSSHAQLSRCASRCCSTTHECSRRWSVVLTSACTPAGRGWGGGGGVMAWRRAGLAG
eukprot:103706-Chlamydomonas_euryale.AAC.1